MKTYPVFNLIKFSYRYMFHKYNTRTIDNDSALCSSTVFGDRRWLLQRDWQWITNRVSLTRFMLMKC